MKVKKSDVRLAIGSSSEGFVFKVLDSIESENGELSGDERTRVLNSVSKWLERSVDDFEFDGK